jgi:hypothetical protein
VGLELPALHGHVAASIGAVPPEPFDEVGGDCMHEIERLVAEDTTSEVPHDIVQGLPGRDLDQSLHRVDVRVVVNAPSLPERYVGAKKRL